MTDTNTTPMVAADHPLVDKVLEYRDEAQSLRVRAALARNELRNVETRASAVARILAAHEARAAAIPAVANRLAELDRETA